MDLSFLPTVNATLNGAAGVLLVTGYAMIRTKRVAAHKRCMIAAFAMSSLFLISYLTHYAWRASVKGGMHTAYNGVGAIKTAYYTMLISHILLAMTVPVFAIWMIRLGLKQRLETHRKVGRIALPIWLYVSVTGVLIYLMLYHWNPA